MTLVPDEAASLAYDVVIIGSGGAGLTAAVIAAQQGLQVAIVEKSHLVGGTTATSGGGAWIPANMLMANAGKGESPDRALAYLRTVIGCTCNEDVIRHFLQNGPDALAYLQHHTLLNFSTRAFSPDYYSDLPDATTSSRGLDTIEYDGRDLGEDLAIVRPARPESLLFGGMAVNGPDIMHLRTMLRSPRSLFHSLRLIFRYAVRRLTFGHDTRLVLGRAMIGRLLMSARQAKVEILLSTPAIGLIHEGKQLAGVDVTHNGVRRTIKAKHAIILATGGFGHDRELIDQWVPYPDHHIAVGVEETNGDGIRMGVAAHARMSNADRDSAYWVPVSVWRKADHSEINFPHLVTDRAKPGIIAVGVDATRFVNEADSYHDFVRGMFARAGNTMGGTFLLCDSVALDRYGLGFARPRPFSRRRLIADGYLISAPTIADLAGKLGLDPAQLEKTVKGYNDNAATGSDVDFGKGVSTYNRAMGDLSQQPNPCMATIVEAPFYAVRVFPGNLGTSRGLVVDEYARALDRSGLPIPKLYVAGNDADAVFQGSYPGPGASLGPALTAGYMAAMDIASMARSGG